MGNFIEFSYANALYFYKRTEGSGEKISASASAIFWSLGLCMAALNFLEIFTGSFAPVIREMIPAVNRPYNNAVEYLIAVPFALLLHYFLLWGRTTKLEEKYAFLAEKHRRWLILVGFLFSCSFAIACGYGRINFGSSLVFAALVLIAQEFFFRYLVQKMDVARF